MTTIGLNSGKRLWMEEKPGRAVWPQTAVRLEWTALYSESEHDGKAQVNGALGTERPTHISRRVLHHIQTSFDELCMKGPFSPKQTLWITLIFQHTRRVDTGTDRYYS
jgi:hypothetical protein